MDRAATNALDIGFAWFLRGEPTIGSAWVGRARRLLTGRPEASATGSCAGSTSARLSRAATSTPPSPPPTTSRSCSPTPFPGADLTRVAGRGDRGRAPRRPRPGLLPPGRSHAARARRRVAAGGCRARLLPDDGHLLRGRRPGPRSPLDGGHPALVRGSEQRGHVPRHLPPAPGPVAARRRGLGVRPQRGGDGM